jgi:ATP-binding cassette, subfamily B, bacterial MsbA
MFGKFLAKMERKLLWRLLTDNFRKQAVWYALAITAMVLVSVATAASAWIMNDIVKSLSAGTPAARVYEVAVIVGGIFAVRGIATYFQAVFLNKAGNGIVAEQQRRMYARLLQQGVAFFNRQGSSDILLSLTQSAQAARSVIDTIVATLARDLLTLVGLVWVMFYQQPLLSIVSLSVIPFTVIAMKSLVRKVREIMTSEMMTLSVIIRVITETSVGIRVIKAFGLESRMMEVMDEAIRAVERQSNGVARLQAATMPLMDILSGFAIAAIMAMSATTIFGERIVTSQGQLMSFLTALIMAYDPARRIASMRVGLEAGMVGVKMMFDILDHPITLVEHPEAKTLASGPGHIVFHDVTFDYGSTKNILEDLSINCAAGKVTALVGPSGGGKSTILNLIMRLYDPGRGWVAIDGEDISRVTLRSLRNRISFVGQETFLFNGSVRHNILLGRPEATDSEVVAAAKAANAHNFILELPGGYDAEVGDNGGNLSGGQRQRLSIARAILRNAPILLLDEATSALDAESEHAIQEALLHLSKGRTTVMIAHRLSSVMRADEVIVIKNGRALEHGSPQSLLQNENFFKRAYDLQFDSPVSKLPEDG